MKNKPLKRTPHLYLFSHEHHDGLVVANRIKAGVTKNVDVRILSNYILSFWESALAEHFRFEESLLLPLFQEEAVMRNRFQAEHEQIRKLINKISAQPQTDQSLAQDFAKLLHDHIRFEERELFPKIQESHSEEVLSGIAEKLNESEATCFVFSERFWE